MLNLKKSIIPHIIDQHAEEAAFLWLLRNDAVNAPHYDLDDLAKLDQRVDAHLDGLRIAGDYAWQVCCDNLEQEESGEVFAAAILALESPSTEYIKQVYKAVKQAPDTIDGLISAFGWVATHNLQGKVKELLESTDPLYQQIGIAACVSHRVDPGKYLEQSIHNEDIALKARALQAVGELGRVDLKALLLEQLTDEEPQIRFWAGWSAVLLGDRGYGLKILRLNIEQNTPFCLSAMPVALAVLETDAVKQSLKILADQQETLRFAIIGAGLSGDPIYIPWLIQQMQIVELARVAGEALTHLCGVDIAYQDLEADVPEDDLEAGPTEDAEDESVEMDADEDLPFPHFASMQQWWQDNQQNFKPEVRYLYGKPIDEEHCLWVLKNATQRLRYLAAVHLALTKPEQVLFEVSEVGQRQQNLLA
ncbi:MAG: TIGR02270 family protein [Methyloprofundus sp.]|nr:TIGR02270 family protein [Methyloprofundus sp.]